MKIIEGKPRAVEQESDDWTMLKKDLKAGDQWRDLWDDKRTFVRTTAPWEEAGNILELEKGRLWRDGEPCPDERVVLVGGPRFKEPKARTTFGNLEDGALFKCVGLVFQKRHGLGGFQNAYRLDDGVRRCFEDWEPITFLPNAVLFTGEGE